VGVVRRSLMTHRNGNKEDKKEEFNRRSPSEKKTKKTSLMI